MWHGSSGPPHENGPYGGPHERALRWPPGSVEATGNAAAVAAPGFAAADKAQREFDERDVVRRVMNCYEDLAERRGESLCGRPGEAEVSG